MKESWIKLEGESFRIEIQIRIDGWGEIEKNAKKRICPTAIDIKSPDVLLVLKMKMNMIWNIY